jgi:ArsR family transcriptional regulator
MTVERQAERKVVDPISMNDYRHLSMDGRDGQAVRSAVGSSVGSALADGTAVAGAGGACGPCDLPVDAGLPDQWVGAIADLCRVLCDPQRLRILGVLMASQQEVCVCDLAHELGRSQPTASYHLKKLEDAGLLSRRSSGKWAYYTPTPAALEALVSLAEIAGGGLDPHAGGVAR